MSDLAWWIVIGVITVAATVAWALLARGLAQTHVRPSSRRRRRLPSLPPDEMERAEEEVRKIEEQFLRARQAEEQEAPKGWTDEGDEISRRTR